jgi:hypothetical protein
MDYFCKECAARPGWEFKEDAAFRHACQRCFQFKPCNDYAYKTGRKNTAPAPLPKDLVPKDHPLSAQYQSSECSLPKANLVPPTPVPVYPVAPPNVDPSDTRTEADKALDALQPNRPGIKLHTTGGMRSTKKEEPKFESRPDSK